MADILRKFELCEVKGSAKEADLGGKRITLPAYVDTGAGRTVCSTRVARMIPMVPTPIVIEYSVPIRARCQAAWTGMRMLEDGCELFVPVLIAVSDVVIRALDLPGGLELLVGQDYLQMGRVSMELRPRRDGGDRLVCRAHEVRRSWIGEAAARVRARLRG
jgi:hypothetical protein